jgi:hypothetical protein
MFHGWSKPNVRDAGVPSETNAALLVHIGNGLDLEHVRWEQAG